MEKLSLNKNDKTKDKSKLKSPTPKFNLISQSPSYGKFQFQIPTLDRIKKAMDYDMLSDKDKKLLLPLKQNIEKIDHENKNNENYHTHLFEPVPIPKPSDWLYEHKEVGQTFKTYSTGIFNQPSKRIKTIYINILEDNEDFFTTEVTDILITMMKAYYPGIDCKLMTKHHSFTDLKVSSRTNFYFQYNAGQTIQVLKNVIPKDGLLILGLTMTDIYPRDEWNFVYGIASKLDGAGVFSFRRHYDSLAETTPKDQLKFAVTKQAAYTMIHETGHLFGLSHCIYYLCLMNGRNHMDEKGLHFLCPVCLRKMYHNLKFDIFKRYEDMLSLFKELSLKYKGMCNDEVEWLTKRLQLM